MTFEMVTSLPDDRIRVDGAIAVGAYGTKGLTFHRIDPRYRSQLPPETAAIETMPAGVRLVFTTDAEQFAIRTTPTRWQFDDEDPLPATFDVVIDGRLVASERADFGHRVLLERSGRTAPQLVPGQAGVIDITGLPPGTKTVELWLPHSARVLLHALEFPAGTELSAAEPDRRPRWLHHGSSISHCMEASSPTRTWPAVAAAIRNQHLIGLGFAGQCQLDQFTARTIRDTTADRISLKLGINVVNGDTMKLRTFPSAVHGFLDTIRDGHPHTPILVISPIWCPSVETSPGPTARNRDGKTVGLATPESIERGSLSLQQIREILAGIVDTRATDGDTNLAYLDGRELFGDADADDLPDDLHPNAAGYVRMGERFAAMDFLTT